MKCLFCGRPDDALLRAQLELSTMEATRRSIDAAIQQQQAAIERIKFNQRIRAAAGANPSYPAPGVGWMAGAGSVRL